MHLKDGSRGRGVVFMEPVQDPYVGKTVESKEGWSNLIKNAKHGASLG